MEQTTKQGALPFELNHGFSQIPNAVMRHYQYYPKFNGNTVIVYGYLIAMYNAKYGYAFPTQDQMAQALNMTDKTVSNHVKLLKAVDLVDIGKRGKFGNQTYTLNKPIEDAELFYEKYPEAAECKRKADATWSKITPVREASKQRFGDAKGSDDNDKIDELADWL